MSAPKPNAGSAPAESVATARKPNEPERQPNKSCAHFFRHTKIRHRLSEATARLGRVQRHIMEDAKHAARGKIVDETVAPQPIRQKDVIHMCVVRRVLRNDGTAEELILFGLIERIVVAPPNVEPMPRNLLCSLELRP